MEEQNQGAAQEQQAQFSIQRIYTKDISFETPNSPAIFQKKWDPEVKLDLDTSSNKLDEGIYEVHYPGYVFKCLAYCYMLGTASFTGPRSGNR